MKMFLEQFAIRNEHADIIRPETSQRSLALTPNNISLLQHELSDIKGAFIQDFSLDLTK
jgi:hypothetical protein